MAFKVVPHPENPLLVWHLPQPDRIYSIGVDVADGGGHGRHFGMSLGDAARSCASTIQVVDAATRIQCAEYQSWSLLPHDLGLLVCKMGRWYGGKVGEAFVVCEANKSGISTIDAMRYQGGYSNLYTRRTFDFVTQKWMNKIGWETTPRTRSPLINQARDVYKALWECVNSPRLQAEIHAFLFQETSQGSGDFRPKAAPGELDDLVIAIALAWLGCDYALAEQTPEEEKVEEKPDDWIWTATKKSMDAQALQKQYGNHFDPEDIPVHLQDNEPGMVTVPDWMWE